MLGRSLTVPLPLTTAIEGLTGPVVSILEPGCLHGEAAYGCFSKLRVLAVRVLLIRVLLFGVCIEGSLIVGNSHIPYTMYSTLIYIYIHILYTIWVCLRPSRARLPLPGRPKRLSQVPRLAHGCGLILKPG